MKTIHAVVSSSRLLSIAVTMAYLARVTLERYRLMELRARRWLARWAVLASLPLMSAACEQASSREHALATTRTLAPQSADYCALPALTAETIRVRPEAGEDPIDDVNWFARPVPHRGTDRIIAFASHNQNYLYNLTTGDRIQIPDRSDAVATPDGKFITVPSMYTPDSTIRFYAVAPLLERLEAGTDAHRVEPVFAHRDEETTRVYYQSTALLAADTVEARVTTTYRLLFSGTANASQFRMVDYRFTEELATERLVGVEPTRPIPLCPEIHNDLNTPFISKDGNYVAAYTSESGDRAYSPGASLKIFRISAPGGEEPAAACRQVADLGFAAGKADFSFDGGMLTFHTSQGAYLTPFVNGGLQRGTITDVAVARLERDARGRIVGHSGVQRLTTSLESGVGSYFPAFFPDGSLFYIANAVPKESDAAKRFHFRVHDPRQGPWRTGVRPDGEALRHWQVLAAQWERACSDELPSLAEPPFPQQAHEAPWLGLALSSRQCHALVADARTGAGSASATDWDALSGLCDGIGSGATN